LLVDPNLVVLVLCKHNIANHRIGSSSSWCSIIGAFIALTMSSKTQSKDLKEILNSIQECVSAIEEILQRMRLNHRPAHRRKPSHTPGNMPQHRSRLNRRATQRRKPPRIPDRTSLHH